ncbi:MAG: HAD-IIIC family phosphatase, partial [Clostridia bacterium]|nr:HAD-IIIC family phosphatase [Clostridia bacterium]
VLGGSTTNDFIKTLEVFLLSEGIEPEFYESEYNRFWQDAMFENPELADFSPDIIYIHTSYRNIASFIPETTESVEEVDAKLNERYSYYEKMWMRLASVYSCPIIQNNFELPPYRLFGNRDCYDIHGAVNFITRLNLRFAEYAQQNQGFYLSDINYIASCFGLDKWFDDQAWYMYKYACSLDAVPYVTKNLSNIIKSIFGKNKKVLALDLDNTLWGGVVGDDGVEGIEIGEETATSECYKAFQEYVKKQKSIGIMLTVASKNDHENAIAGLNHPEGVLRPDDFIVIKANWETKDRNLVATANEMDLGIDSFVFADDNPTERALLERSIKGIAIPVFDVPADYIRTIDRNGYFEVTNFSSDDLKRNDMYKANVKRAELSTEFADYNEYLLSLDMKGEIKPFSPVYMQRITQLTNKSNQFNLTTKRYTQPEIETVASDGKHITLYGKLSDAFGDNGVVSVVIGEIKENVCDIDLWLMSCRVLKKNMEFAMLDTLVKECKDRSIDTIVGHYYPTAKNGMVKNLFNDFGFEKNFEGDDGTTEWKLTLNDYQNKNNVIKVNTEE